LWKRLIYQGIHEGLTETQIQDIKFINREALTAFLISFPSVPLCYISLPDTDHYLVLLCIFCFYGSPVFFNRIRLYGYAKAAILLVAAVSIFWSSSTFGKESNLHYIFAILIFGTIVNFHQKEKVYLGFVLCVIIIFLITLYASDFAIFAQEKLSPRQLDIVQYASLYTCLAGSVSMAFFYINKFTKQRQKISQYNEELERKFEELQKLNTELDRFVYSVSHDLRAPITSVLGLAYLGKRTQDLTEIYQYFDLQEKSLKKLDNFIADILNYSRNNRTEVKMQNIDFLKEFENILELQRQYEPNYQIQTSLMIKQENAFFTDKQRLVIALNNLISNAFRYHNPYQQPSWIKVVVEVLPQKALIIISDNGIGISKEHLEKVFEMFYRATEKTPGSGLGLYIVKETINKLKGTIKVASEIGKGTSFTIEIPNLAT
jgi:signal transduction histidine kinase